jgi:hypothetical protein
LNHDDFVVSKGAIMRLRLRIPLFIVLAASFAGRQGAATPGLDLTTVSPCRWIDTRISGGPLAPGERRTFAVAGACDVPPWARALALNVTAVGPAAGGTLTLLAAGEGEPLVSTLEMTAGRTSSNNALVALPADGSAAITAHNDSAGSVALVLDVSAYFARSGCTPPPPAMAAWWPFDETAGSVARDLAGGHDGVFVNGPAPVAGMVDGARSFNGSNQSVQVPDADGIDFGTGDYSFDAWLRTSGSGTFVDVILDKRSFQAGYFGYHFYLYQGRLGLQLADGDYDNYNSAAFVADGAWHHVAITVQRAAHDGIRWYVDGTEVLPRYDPTLHPGSLDNGSPLSLAVRSAALGGGGNFQGLLDEVELFSRALSAEEVQAIWQAGAGGKCR